MFDIRAFISLAFSVLIVHRFTSLTSRRFLTIRNHFEAIMIDRNRVFSKCQIGVVFTFVRINRSSRIYEINQVHIFYNCAKYRVFCPIDNHHHVDFLNRI